MIAACWRFAKRYWLRVLGAHLLLGVFGGWVVLHFAAPYWLLVPPPLDPSARVTSEAQARILARAERVRWQSHDALELVALRYRVPSARGRFLVLHGIGSCKEQQAGLCQRLNDLGFEAIAVDFRAHGESAGKYTTFGYLEKRDLSALLDAYPSELPTYTWGASLGGAVALQALEYDERLLGGVIVSAFASLEELALDRQEAKIGVRWAWPWHYIMARARTIAGLPTEGVSPEAVCRQIEQPVFLAHGTDDMQIDIRYARRNFAALASRDKLLYEIEGAGHDDLWERGGEGFRTAFERFIETRFVGPH